MNRQTFIRRYGEVVMQLRQSPRDVVVSGGGGLIMLGLRESTSDLDLDVKRSVLNRVKTRANTEYFGAVEIVNLTDEVSLQVLDPHIETIMVDGVCIYSIDELLKLKRGLLANPNRYPTKIEQDKQDIEALLALKKKHKSSSFR